MTAATLVVVGPDNFEECGIGCLSNRKHEGYGPKVEWLQQRFDEGLRYFLFRDEAGKALAFLEFVPGEFAWRPVDASGWLFIHCLWVYRAGQQIGGLGSRLMWKRRNGKTYMARRCWSAMGRGWRGQGFTSEMGSKSSTKPDAFNCLPTV